MHMYTNSSFRKNYVNNMTLDYLNYMGSCVINACALHSGHTSCRVGGSDTHRLQRENLGHLYTGMSLYRINYINALYLIDKIVNLSVMVMKI